MVKDALQLMVECYLEEGRKLPKPNPKALDPTAKRIEKVRVEVLVHQPVRRQGNDHGLLPMRTGFDHTDRA
jgi:hypothetical protein